MPAGLINCLSEAPLPPHRRCLNGKLDVDELRMLIAVPVAVPRNLAAMTDIGG
jgi:hypothetical protein